MDMAAIAWTPGDGSCRLVLTAEDAAARAVLMGCCSEMGLVLERGAATVAIAFGSHLDTVPTRGRFDGIVGCWRGWRIRRMSMWRAGGFRPRDYAMMKWAAVGATIEW
jgi:N-carbamoyl-L-amino-acid hydrolase